MSRESTARLAALGRLIDYAIQEAEDMALPMLKTLLGVALTMIAENLSQTSAASRSRSRPRTVRSVAPQAQKSDAGSAPGSTESRPDAGC